MIEKPDIL